MICDSCIRPECELRGLYAKPYTCCEYVPRDAADVIRELTTRLRATESAARVQAESTVECHALIRDMLMALVLAMSGNGDPRELNLKLVEFTDRMEALGVIPSD